MTRVLAMFVAFILAGCGAHAALPPANGATITFAVKVPALSGIRPQYVSPAAQSVDFNLTLTNCAKPDCSTGGTSANVHNVVALSGSNCTSSGSTKVCTATSYYTTSQLGNDHFIVRTFASTDGTGSALSAAQINATIVNWTNTISATLNGVVGAVAFSPPTIEARVGHTDVCTNGTPCTGAVVFQPRDGSGDTIVAPGVYGWNQNGDAASFTITCPPHLALQDANGNVVTSIASPATNTIAKFVYDGTVQAGNLTCTASNGHLTATFGLVFF